MSYKRGREGSSEPKGVHRPSEDHGAGMGDYPHVGGCRSCAAQRVCNACGAKLDGNRCTNGRCADCHRHYCTPGGDTSPGHGYGTITGGAS